MTDMTQTDINPRDDDRMAPVPEGAFADLRQQLQAVLHKSAISQAQVGREIGYSTTVISQFLNASYGGDIGKVAEAVAQWLAGRKECHQFDDGLVRRPGFVETATSTEFMRTLTWAQTLSKFVLMCGAPGIGKTLTARQYVSARPNVWMVTMQPMTKSPTHLMNEIESAFSLSHRRGGSQMRRIGDFVRDKQGLLIIDEGQHLTTEALDQLRSIQDRHECGIAVLGNEGLKLRLAGDGTQAEFAQLTSRIGIRLHRPNARPEDTEAMIDAWNITNGAMRDYLIRIARRPGHLRVMDSVITLACQVADGEGKPLGIDHLKQAYAYQSSQQIDF